MILTADQFVNAIGQVEADNVAGLGPRDDRTLDLPRIAIAAMAAHEQIVGRIGQRYPVPPQSEMLRGVAVDIMFYRLRLKTGDQSGVNEEVRARYNAALKTLDDIALGKLTLGDDANALSGNPVAPVGGVILVAGTAPRAASILEGW